MAKSGEEKVLFLSVFLSQWEPLLLEMGASNRGRLICGQ